MGGRERENTIVGFVPSLLSRPSSCLKQSTNRIIGRGRKEGRKEGKGKREGKGREGKEGGKEGREGGKEGREDHHPPMTTTTTKVTINITTEATTQR